MDNQRNSDNGRSQGNTRFSNRAENNQPQNENTGDNYYQRFSSEAPPQQRYQDSTNATGVVDNNAKSSYDKADDDAKHISNNVIESSKGRVDDDQPRFRDDQPQMRMMQGRNGSDSLGGFRSNNDFYKVQDPKQNQNKKYIEFKKTFYQEVEKEYDPKTIEAFRADFDIQVVPQPFIGWDDCKFPKTLQDVVTKLGFEFPTPIQAQVFPILLSGFDLIGIAETGSGKTISFLIPGMIHLNAQPPPAQGEGPIMLILAPTRELAMQIQEQVELFCPSSVCVYGGAEKGPQARKLRQGVKIVVATPGRLKDFLDYGDTNLDRVTFLVIDEADRMLDLGFEPQIRSIVSQIRPDRQTSFYSATWPRDVQTLAQDFCQENPVHIQIGNEELTINKHIEHIIQVLGSRREKRPQLYKLLDGLTQNDKILIFARTKIDCENLSQELSQDGYFCLSLHGDKSQQQRDYVMNQLKISKARLVCATDLAARGLDVKDITYVINYDFPKQIEDFIHRVGRTGRAGVNGKAVSFLEEGVDDCNLAKQLIDVMEKAGSKVPKELSDYANSGQRVSFRGGRGRGSGRGGGFRGNDRGGRGFDRDRDQGRNNYERSNFERHDDRPNNQRGGFRSYQDNGEDNRGGYQNQDNRRMPQDDNRNNNQRFDNREGGQRYGGRNQDENGSRFNNDRNTNQRFDNRNENRGGYRGGEDNGRTQQRFGDRDQGGDRVEEPGRGNQRFGDRNEQGGGGRPTQRFGDRNEDGGGREQFSYGDRNEGRGDGRFNNNGRGRGYGNNRMDNGNDNGNFRGGRNDEGGRGNQRFGDRNEDGGGRGGHQRFGDRNEDGGGRGGNQRFGDRNEDGGGRGGNQRFGERNEDGGGRGGSQRFGERNEGYNGRNNQRNDEQGGRGGNQRFGERQEDNNARGNQRFGDRNDENNNRGNQRFNDRGETGGRGNERYGDRTEGRKPDIVEDNNTRGGSRYQDKV